VAAGKPCYFPTFDGNGNVSEYLSGAGASVAHYEYDPFGRSTTSTGTLATSFAHRFSTKPVDGPTGLYYYGYRYLDPASGRWPSKDPLEEEGGVNLYGLLKNDGVNALDYLGMWFADGRPRGTTDDYTFALDGNGGYMIMPGKVGSDPDVKQAANDHEQRHIDSVASSDQSHAVPFKQVYCLEKDGKIFLYYLRFLQARLQRTELKAGESMLWPRGTGVMFMTAQLQLTEDIRETDSEIKQLKKAGGTKAVAKRISFLDEVLVAYRKANAAGDNPAWSDFKREIESEKAVAKKHGYTWAWKDESKVYTEIK